MKKIFLTIMIIFVYTNLILAQQPYPITTINGIEYYEYTIITGDGLYSISKRFGVSQTDLHNANFGLTNDIKAGQKILIPIKKEVITKVDSTAIIHIVEAKQTLYGISKQYNVSIDSIIAHNPSSKNGLQIGEKLIIPQNKINIEKEKEEIFEGIRHKVQRKETLYSISKKYNVAIHDLITANPELEKGLKAGTTIIITSHPNCSKGEESITLTTEEKDNEINTEKKNINIKELNNTIEKNNNENKEEKKSLKSRRKKRNDKRDKERDEINDFVSNALNGNENIFEYIPIDSIVSDTIDSINKPISIVYLLPIVPENEEEIKTTQRFTEFYRGSLIALKKAKSNGISANIHTYSTGKNIEKIYDILNELDSIDIDIIIGPAYTSQLDTVISYAKSRDIVSMIPFSSKIDSLLFYPKLIQFNPPQEDLFTKILTNTFAPKKRNYVIGRFKNCNNKGNTFADELIKLLNLNGVTYKELTLNPDNIPSLVKSFKSDSTLLLLASTSITDVAPILEALSQSSSPKLELWGFEEWGTNLIKKYPRTLFYSLFNPIPTDEYIEIYQKWFGAYKHNIGVRYDMIGYDLTSLAINNVTINDNSIDINTADYHDFMQSFPKFNFINNRWLNTNYYLFFWNNIIIKAIK